MQRLQRDVERAVPRAGAEVPRVQLLQHPGDEGRPGARRALQSLKQRPHAANAEEVLQSKPPKRPCPPPATSTVHHGRGCR